MKNATNSLVSSSLQNPRNQQLDETHKRNDASKAGDHLNWNWGSSAPIRDRSGATVDHEHRNDANDSANEEVPDACCCTGSRRIITVIISRPLHLTRTR